MTGADVPTRERRRRPSPWRRRVAVTVALVVVFGVGVALGKALEDGPEGGVVVTSVRTLEPLPQEPASTTP